MSDKARLTIAAAMVALFLAVTSISGLLIHTPSPNGTVTAPKVAVPAAPQIHHENFNDESD
jgi:hypothetical protein